MNNLEKSILLSIKQYLRIKKFYKQNNTIISFTDEEPYKPYLKELSTILNSIIDKEPRCNHLTPSIDYNVKQIGDITTGFINMSYLPYFPPEPDIYHAFKEIDICILITYSDEMNIGTIMIQTNFETYW